MLSMRTKQRLGEKEASLQFCKSKIFLEITKTRAI